MKSSSFEQAIQAQFDCLTKKVVKRAASKYRRDISRRLKHEAPFSELPEHEINQFSVCDKYSSDYTAFNVLGMEVKFYQRRNAILFCCHTLWICPTLKLASL